MSKILIVIIKLKLSVMDWPKVSNLMPLIGFKYNNNNDIII